MGNRTLTESQRIERLRKICTEIRQFFDRPGTNVIGDGYGEIYLSLKQVLAETASGNTKFRCPVCDNSVDADGKSNDEGCCYCDSCDTCGSNLCNHGC